MNCVFCKIINGQLPMYKIFEDEHTLAFLDISKDVDGHTLVVPKAHCQNVLDVDQENLQRVFQTVKKVSNHYVNNCGYEGVNILNASGEAAGQSVFHFHVHIFPRKNQDGISAWPNNKAGKRTLEQMEQALKLNS